MHPNNESIAEEDGKTPPASNQGSARNEPAALNGQPDSRSSPYETEALTLFSKAGSNGLMAVVSEGRDKRNRPAREPDAISNAVGCAKFFQPLT